MNTGLKIFIYSLLIVGLGVLFFNGAEHYRSLDEIAEVIEARDREVMTPEFEIQNVVITFYMYDTIEDLREEVDWDNELLLGLSDCEWKEKANIAYCDIFAVRPKFIDDEEACTIGHEVMHAMYGLYHTPEYGYVVGSGCK